MKMLDSGSHKINLSHVLQIGPIKKDDGYQEAFFYTILFLCDYERSFYFQDELEAMKHRELVIEQIESE